MTMKTPEKIKKGLKCCNEDYHIPCWECPYNKSVGITSPKACYPSELKADALAYIQQLEAQRNALIADLNAVCKSVNVCLACSHYRTDWPKPGCELNGLTCKWCWRGVQK